MKAPRVPARFALAGHTGRLSRLREGAAGEGKVMIRNLHEECPLGMVTVRPCPEERRRLGHAIWLFLLLLERTGPADTLVQSGASIRAADLATGLGIGARQARRQLQALRRAGYVELQNTGRGFTIRVLGPSGRSVDLP